MKKRVLFALSLLVLLGYNVVILQNPHLVRLSLVEITELSDPQIIYQKPGLPNDPFVYEVEAAMPKVISDLHPTNERSRLGNNIPYLVKYYGSVLEKTDKASNLIPESVLNIQDAIYKDLTRGSCYIDARLFVSKMQKVGYYARLVSFVADDGLGGKGHTVVEVWEPVNEKWAMVDPQQAAVFFGKKGELLSAYEVRRLLLDGHADDSIVAKQGPGYRVARVDLWSFYRETIMDIHYDTRNDLYTVATSWEGKSYGAVESSSIIFGKTMVQIGRLLRSLLIPQRRFRIIDEYSGDSYRPDVFYSLFRVVNTFTFLICLYLAIVASRKLCSAVFG